MFSSLRNSIAGRLSGSLSGIEMKFCFAKLQIIIQKSKFENNKFKIIKFKMKDKRAKSIK
jgi:hypothetical protein